MELVRVGGLVVTLKEALLAGMLVNAVAVCLAFSIDVINHLNQRFTDLSRNSLPLILLSVSLWLNSQTEFYQGRAVLFFVLYGAAWSSYTVRFLLITMAGTEFPAFVPESLMLLPVYLAPTLASQVTAYWLSLTFCCGTLVLSFYVNALDLFKVFPNSWTLPVGHRLRTGLN